MKASRNAGDEGVSPPEPHVLSFRRRAALTATCLSVLIAAAAVVGWPSSRSRPGRAASAVPAPSTMRTSPGSGIVNPQRRYVAAAPAPPQPVVETVVARMKGTFPGYYRPGGSAVKLQVPKTWETEPSTLPVIGSAPGGWLQVRLAQRPDEDTAWIHTSDAIESTTPYRIVVNLETTHLQLYEGDRLVLDAPAGVGAPGTPTPLGEYFVAFLEPPIGPEYGAFIMITSAHSQAIQSWDGTGDAIIGIHGPIGADAEIGTTGAHISNGCVRLHDNDLLRLEDVPPGTPIDIID